MLGPKLHCGGAIITDLHILTAGHCITFGFVLNQSVFFFLYNINEKFLIAAPPVIISVFEVKVSLT